uniref:Sm domain-containing protein n=1 Tax=Rhodnius prolixus TaxID=13249 RepID=T1HB81_RHOPR
MASLFQCMMGVLACLDGYMNIALEQTEEYVNGQLKEKYGDAFLRDVNKYFKTDVIEYLSTLYRKF